MLPTNPILASFTLLSWLFLTPSAWRRYVATINPQLPADFALAHLSAQSWQQPELWRLLSIGHGLWSLWVSGIVSIWLWSQHIESEALLLASCYALCFSFCSGIIGSAIISVAYGITIGIVGGILLSLPIGFGGQILFSMAENIAIAVMLSLPDLQLEVQAGDPRTLLTVLLGIFTAGLAGNVMHSTTISIYRYRHRPYRQLGSVVIGVIVSSIMVLLIVKLTSTSARVAASLMENSTLFSLVYDSLTVSVFGLSLAIIWWLRNRRWQQALWLGISVSVAFGLLTLLKNQFSHALFPYAILINGIHGGIENAILYLLLFAFPFVLANRIAAQWAGIIAGICGSAGVYLVFAIVMERYAWQFVLPLTLLALVLGLSVNWWRPLLFYPVSAAWNLLLYRADEKRIDKLNSFLRYHSAFWDEHQYLPLFGLENYLVLVAEHNPSEGQAALDHLSRSPQSWAAQEAQIELDARRLQQCREVTAISIAHRELAAGELSSPVSALLRSFSRISRDVEAALKQESTYNQRLALDAVEERLDGLLRELTRSSEPYALRFHPIAASWRQTLADYARVLGEAVESRQEISNPYVIGIPLTEHQEIFVGRSDASERIERLLLDNRCPPLLLYGQRRTGKTSLLNNLGRLLPTTIIPLFVDLQGPTSLAKNYTGFLYNMGRAILASAKRHREILLPALTKDSLADDPFTRFDEWLDEIELHIDPQQTLLLILDEFSALEHVFNKGLLDETLVLGMFRHLIQHRPRFKILLSGSHTIDEFERWASYLINVQIVHLSYLQANEALKLVEHPVKDFALRYTESASRRILEVTRCHPALIQLVCAEIVTLKNRQHLNERRLAQLEDVNAAIPGALQHGRFFFADIANNQITDNALLLLKFIAARGENALVNQETCRVGCQLTLADCEAALANLLQRELIELLGRGYRFQVELIRRWFA